MMEIDAMQRSPLEQLAVDWFLLSSGKPSDDFCRRAVGVPESDEKIARRLRVAISTVREWRDRGKLASRWNCQ